MEVKELTSNAGGAIAGADDLLALARTTDTELSAPVPGSAAALELEQQQQQQQASEPKLTLEQEFAGMFAMVAAGAGHWLPSVGQVLNDKACADLGRVLAPVAAKYGLARYFEGFAWRVELQALMVVVPIGAAIAGAVKHDLAELERRQRVAEGHPLASSPAAAAIGASSSSPASESAIAGAPPAQPGMLQPIERPQ